MIFRLLTEADFDVLYVTSQLSFADYFVPSQATPAQYERMMIRNGVRYDFSVGVFESEDMIGFTINGVDQWRGKFTAFDAQTGVLPEYRGRGIATRIFDFILPHLNERGVEQYLLEVITENKSAVRLYRKLGFEITRNFAVYRLENPFEPKPVPPGLTIKEIYQPNWQLFAEFCDFQPSWQNSTASTQRSITEKVTLGAFVEDECIGYGIVVRPSGDVSQFAVDKRFRGRGIGSALLSALQPRADKPLRMTNVDRSAKDVVAFCERHGFRLIAEQYEMLLPL